jgi:hypothetical protein
MEDRVASNSWLLRPIASWAVYPYKHSAPLLQYAMPLLAFPSTLTQADYRSLVRPSTAPLARQHRLRSRGHRARGPVLALSKRLRDGNLFTPSLVQSCDYSHFCFRGSQCKIQYRARRFIDPPSWDQATLTPGCAHMAGLARLQGRKGSRQGHAPRDQPACLRAGSRSAFLVRPGFHPVQSSDRPGIDRIRPAPPNVLERKAQSCDSRRCGKYRE